MKRFVLLRVIGLLALALGLSCTKEPDFVPPPLSNYRTHDLVTVAAKEDPLGGYLLLCKNTTLDERTSFLQVLSATGELAARIPFTLLPLTIDSITFSPLELWYTDFVPRADGSIVVLGLGRQVELNNSLYVIVHLIDRQGSELIPPFHRPLTSNAMLVVNQAGDRREDLNGLPRSRVFGALCSNDLNVAARWETTTDGGIDVFRFPLPGSTNAPLHKTRGSNTTNRLHGIACDPVDGHVIIVSEGNTSAENFRTVCLEFTPEEAGWTEQSVGVVEAPALNNEPTKLLFRDGKFTLVGYAPMPNNQDKVKPFTFSFVHAVEMNTQEPMIMGSASDDIPVTAYCAGWWNNDFQLITNTHPSATRHPFFDDDISSDLSVSMVSLTSHTVNSTTTIVPGQGLRPIGYFTDQGSRVVIGSQFAYLNTGVTHTFFLRIADDR